MAGAWDSSLLLMCKLFELFFPATVLLIDYIFSGITTVVSVYRGKSSIWEYLTAGVLTGSLYKFSMGPRGMLAGGLVGGAFGTIAGGLSLLILRTTGMSMEEVRYLLERI